MKRVLLLLFVSLGINNFYGQVSGIFIVNGDSDKFYPVTFFDGGWSYNVPTQLVLGRSNVHTDSSWRGALMGTFKYHVTNWGHGSNFIDADIANSVVGIYNSFIAGWIDVSGTNASSSIVIWLRGATTYYYQSNYAVNPTIYDGMQNPLPYSPGGGSYSFKTALDNYVTTREVVNLYSETAGSGIRFNASSLSTGSRNWGITSDGYGYGDFAIKSSLSPTSTITDVKFIIKPEGNVGIGTATPDSKLTVNGNIHAKEVKIDLSIPAPDYVFASDYKLKTLQEVEDYIKANSHLPEIPSAKEFEKNGILLAAMNMSLLKKIEELTLYMIEQNKKLEVQEKQSNKQSNQIEHLSKKIELLEKANSK